MQPGASSTTLVVPVGAQSFRQQSEGLESQQKEDTFAACALNRSMEGFPVPTFSPDLTPSEAGSSWHQQFDPFKGSHLSDFCLYNGCGFGQPAVGGYALGPHPHGRGRVPHEGA